MIKVGSILDVADNSGAKRVKCIKVLGGSGKDSARIGDEIVVSIRTAIPSAKVKEGDVCLAVVARVKQKVGRFDGSHIKFGSFKSSSAVVLINKQMEPIGTRVFGPIPRELKNKGFVKIISLAPEVL